MTTDIQSPNLKPNAIGVAMALSKCYAGNLFATAVYKKTYIREQINDMIVLSQSPAPPFYSGLSVALQIISSLSFLSA